MSETYVTYRVWGGCKAPLNLEYDGRLIGEIARELTVDRDALLALADEIDRTATWLLEANGLDPNRKRRSMRREHAQDLMAVSSRIRKALGVEHD